MEDEAYVDHGVTLEERLVFRKAFLSNHDGRSTLKWLLLNLGLYKPMITEEEVVLHNFAIKLLHILGLSDQDKLEKMIDYYETLAAEDALNPAKRNMIRSKIDGSRN
jgi:hypothetical protein